MSEERIQNITSPQPEEQEIDLIELAQKVWASRKLVFKACGIAALVGLVVAFSIPKEYSTSVTLAPESGGKSGGGSMGALAAMAGINLGTSSGEDALSPELYPDIVSSTPFLIELFDVKVKDQKAKVDTTLYAYLKEEQRSPWWSAIFSAPFKVLGWTLSLFKDEPEEGDAKLDPFRLTKDESAIADALSKRISVSVDKKTGVTTLSVTMQDPLISASLTDTVMHCLQNYITDYRTNKARHDLAFTEKLYGEAKASYEDAQKKYANFVDANQNIILLSYRAEQERLQNEMNLAYQVYTQVSQQLQMARAKVQEITPVYTVVQPATVPLKPAKPNKLMILIGCPQDEIALPGADVLAIHDRDVPELLRGEFCVLAAGRELGPDTDVDDGIVVFSKGRKEIRVLHEVRGSGFRHLAAVLHMGEYIGGADGNAVQQAFLAHQDVHGDERDIPLPQQRFGQVTGAVRSNLDLHVRYSSSVRRAGPQRVGFFKILNYHSTKA